MCDSSHAENYQRSPGINTPISALYKFAGSKMRLMVIYAIKVRVAAIPYDNNSIEILRKLLV
jgi:hypothetical protein